MVDSSAFHELFKNAHPQIKSFWTETLDNTTLRRRVRFGACPFASANCALSLGISGFHQIIPIMDIT
jgi:hypothetical protein